MAIIAVFVFKEQEFPFSFQGRREGYTLCPDLHKFGDCNLGHESIRIWVRVVFLCLSERQLLGKGGEALCRLGLDFKRGREE